MTDTPDPQVVATLEDDDGLFCVDILRHADGHFTYVEYSRDESDPDAWHAREEGDSGRYKTEYAAYAAAMRNVDWLTE